MAPEWAELRLQAAERPEASEIVTAAGPGAGRRPGGGDLDEALRIRHHEQLSRYEQLGNVEGIAAANWGIAQIALAQGDPGAAVPRMLTAYDYCERGGRAEGLAVVGEAVGRWLGSAGERERAVAILRRSRESYEKLGRHSDAERVGRLLAEADTGGAE